MFINYLGVTTSDRFAVILVDDDSFCIHVDAPDSGSVGRTDEIQQQTVVFLVGHHHLACIQFPENFLFIEI